MNAKENLRETIFGTPKRFSNNYEACYFTFSHPFGMHNPAPKYGETNVVDAWGVTNSFLPGTPGKFPVHTPERVVIKDYGEWDKYVKFPSLDWPEEEWEKCIKNYQSQPFDKTYAAVFIAPGIFERMHHLGGIDNALMALYEYEDESHDLIKHILDWEMKYAEQICEKIHPEAIFHHDDWGSMTSTFMSVGMFEDYFMDAYKQLYGYYHDHGVDVIFHHSDSYGATLVPDMIEMGINVWQGAVQSNNIPELVRKYGDKLTIMGGFDGAMIDKPGMTKELVKEAAYKFLDEVGTPKGFVPCVAQGGAGSIYKNIYEWLWESIDEYNIEKMGATKEEIEDRAPRQIIFPGMMED